MTNQVDISISKHFFTNRVPGLVNVNKKLLKMAIEIVDLPSYKIVIFNSKLLVYQRVNRMIDVGVVVCVCKPIDVKYMTRRCGTRKQRKEQHSSNLVSLRICLMESLRK